MKRIVYVIIAVAFLGSCATTTKTTEATKVKPIPPEGVTFTKVENLREFASIQMPFDGNGFGKDESFHSNKTDAGKDVGIIKYNGDRVYLNDENDLTKKFKITVNKSDINSVLEDFKKRSFLRTWLKKENVIEEYSDVVIGDKTCKRVFVSYNWDDSTDFYTLAYLIPYQETMALFFIDQATTSPAMLEEEVRVLDSAFKYMIETVKFKN